MTRLLRIAVALLFALQATTAHALNVSVPPTGAPALWGGTPPNYPANGVTGKGVIVGIVGTGLDLTHADFRTATGTRVKFVWDHLSIASPQPAGWAYGTESNEALINAGGVTQSDNASAGTYGAGVAAGNGRATGNGQPQYQYVGMAPEADLVVVKCDLSQGRIIDGVTYVFQKAEGMGKACVVLIPGSTGNQGAHDGSDSYETALSALTGPGKIIVVPAGDNGGKAEHAQINLTATGQSVTISCNIPPYTPNVNFVEVLDVGGWHAPSAIFNARLTSPNGFSTGWVVPATSNNPLRTPDGSMSLSNDITTNSKGAKQIRVYISETDTFPPKVGVWNLELERLAGATTGLLDAWIADWAFGSNGVAPVFTSQINYTQLVQSPATGDSIISAGGYTSRNTWINAGGSESFYPENPVIGAIAALSSPGPRRDGVQRPDVTGPSEGVAGAASSQASPAIGNSSKARDGVHVVRRTTYGAAAHVAGACALLLQQNPTLTPSGARTMLAQRAKSDGDTGPVPNATWGYGKLSFFPSANCFCPSP